MKKLLITLLVFFPLISFAALEDNLTAYYKMGTGALTTDSVAGTYTLTDVGTVAETATGLIEYGADYGASNSTDCHYINNTTGTTRTGARTVLFWAKYRGSSGFVTLYNHYYGGNPGAYTRVAYDVPNTLYLFTNSNITYNIDITDGWHQIGYTFDGTTFHFYVDGVDRGNDTAFANNYPYGQYFSIGCHESDEGGTPNGFASTYLDEIGVWSRELTSTEVNTLYNSGLGKTYTGGAFVDPPSAGTPYAPFWNVWLFGDW